MTTPFFPSRAPDAGLRVGTTSQVYPGGWLANARRLAFRVHDMELLCFDAESLPDRDELQGLLEIKQQAGLSYTLHAPATPSLVQGSWLARRRAVTSLRRIITRTRRLAPSAYVIHLGENVDVSGEGNTEAARYRKRAASAVRRLLRTGLPSRSLCLHCNGENHWLVAPLAEQFDLSLAVDISRWDTAHDAMQPYLEQQLPRIRVIEWHGVDPDGRDHGAITLFPTEAARWLLGLLDTQRYQGVLTLKVLSEEDFEESLRFIAQALHPQAGARPPR